MLRGGPARAMAVSILVIFYIVFVPRPALFAAPLPPELVVNHETKECAEISGGDECMACYAPGGWETVGFAHKAECPEGYTRIEGLEAECQAFKDGFCCSEGHSGVHGDCEDLVVHKKRKQCAFVEDIHNIVLPEGWDKRPEGMASDRWFCPNNYTWLESLDTVPNADLDSTPEVVEEKPTLPWRGTHGACSPWFVALQKPKSMRPWRAHWLAVLAEGAHLRGFSQAALGQDAFPAAYR